MAPSAGSTIALARTRLAIAETLTSTPRAEESADYAQRTIDTLEGLETSDADEVRVMAEQRLGTAMLNRGRPDDALAHFQRALDASERLAAGGDPVLVRRLTIGLNEMGLTLSRLGRQGEALPYLERSLALRTAAAEANPGSVRAQRDLTLVRHRLGDVRGDMDDMDGAIELYARARDTLAGIAQADESDARARFDWSIAEEKLANALLESGRTAEAREGYAASGDLRTRLAEDNPDNRLYRNASGIAIERVAHCDRLLGEHDAARAGYDRAIAIAREGIAADDTDVRVWTLLVSAQQGQGESCLDASEPDAAAARQWLLAARISLETMLARGMTPTREPLTLEAIDALLARCE